MRGRLREPVAGAWDFPRAASGVTHLVAYAEQHGLGAGRLLAGTGLTAADLRVAGQEVTAAQELGVIRTLQRHLGPGAGRAVGESYHLTSFGTLGWAMLGSRTVADAVDEALRYLDLSFTFALPRADLVGDRVRVTVDGSTLPAHVRGFLLARDLAAIRTALGELVAGGVPTTEAVDGAVGVLESWSSESTSSTGSCRGPTPGWRAWVRSCAVRWWPGGASAPAWPSRPGCTSPSGSPRAPRWIWSPAISD